MLMCVSVWLMTFLPGVILGQECCQPSPHEGTLVQLAVLNDYDQGPPSLTFGGSLKYSFDRDNQRAAVFYADNAPIARDVRFWHEGELRIHLFTQNDSCTTFIVPGQDLDLYDYCVPDGASLNSVYTLGNEYGPLQQWVYRRANITDIVYQVNPETCRITTAIVNTYDPNDEVQNHIALTQIITNMTLGIEDDTIWEIPDDCEDVDPPSQFDYRSLELSTSPLMGVSLP